VHALHDEVEIQMATHTEAGQTINVVPNYSGIRIVVECHDEVCEPIDIGLSADEWSSLVAQGFVALAKGGL
jgi:hypothetical protein